MYDTSFLEYSIAAGRCQVCFHDEGQCFSERKRVEEMLAKAPKKRTCSFKKISASPLDIPVKNAILLSKVKESQIKD